MAARGLSPTDVLAAIDAASAGEAVDLEALRGAIRARADQLDALTADPQLNVVQAEDARKIGAWVASQVAVVDVLEAEGPGPALLAWLAALSTGFGGST